jgi:sarcosine oxidase gamma subunit
LLQVINSLTQTCYNNWEQAVRRQFVDSLWTYL